MQFIRVCILNILGFSYERSQEYEKAIDCFMRAAAIRNADVNKEVRQEAADGVPRCRMALAARDRKLSPNATKEQVRAYAQEIVKAVPAGIHRQSDVQVSKLVEIGPQNLDVLLDLNLPPGTPGLSYAGWGMVEASRTALS